ncbi:MAG: hypothetical protein JWO38_1315 [Gemmataceae bacterium]|nr:hypothetical protein [Gemmataceae bacterium]
MTWNRVPADAVFDSKAHHRYSWEDLGVRSIVIPINPRGQGRKWPKTTYRRYIVKRFWKKPWGSRSKRVYGHSSGRWNPPFPDTSGDSGVPSAGGLTLPREREGYP